ncbi:MAG: lipid-A-disaccharide synthase [Pyrinomonadaceae bacterium]
MNQIQKKIMIVAGESSGDSHAANLVKAMREGSPGISFEFFGATGKKMREAGVETVVEADHFGIIGVPEVAKALPMFWRVFQTLKRAAIERAPDAVILVDFPEFNLKLAKALKHSGLKVVYYISPQLWAWRKYRARAIKNYVGLLLAILPFEKNWYSERGIRNVEYVGNPLAGEVKVKLSKEEFCVKHNLDPSRPVIALLAGSRKKEVSRILPVLLETASMMAEKEPSLQFVNAIASTRSDAEIAALIADFTAKGKSLPEKFVSVRDETYDALNAADAAAVTSGTATLETAIIGTPLVVVYKSTNFNWYAIRPLISVEHFGLVNLIAQKRVAKELIQFELTPDTVGDELFRLLEPETNKRIRNSLANVSRSLGKGGASARAAEAIADYLNYSS